MSPFREFVLQTSQTGSVRTGRVKVGVVSHFSQVMDPSSFILPISLVLTIKLFTERDTLALSPYSVDGCLVLVKSFVMK